MLPQVIFGRTGLRVSCIAFGGIPIMRLGREEGVRLVREVLDLGVTFIDTAHGYGHSEELIGEALRDVPRQSVVITTKSPAAGRKELLADLEESLRRLRTDVIDVFQLHMVSSRAKMDAVMGDDGAFEGLQEAVQAGKVRFPGFSSHSLPIAAEMIRTDMFDAVQVPFNFVDCQAADEVIPLALEHRMGIIAMKPLGGGMLDDARLCFRFLSQYPQVVPDPGVETISQMREILSVVAEHDALRQEETRRIERCRAALSGVWCHRCEYCQPCPQGIPISSVLTAESFPRRMPMPRVRDFIEKPMAAAEACTECRQCVSRCPYNLEIPDLLKSQRAAWARYLSTGAWPTPSGR
jgi:uncharacterized protein